MDMDFFINSVYCWYKCSLIFCFCIKVGWCCVYVLFDFDLIVWFKDKFWVGWYEDSLMKLWYKFLIIVWNFVVFYFFGLKDFC